MITDILMSILTIICLLYIVWDYFIIKNLRRDLLLSKQDYSKLLSQKKSSEVRLGQISEHLAPFLNNFKYNPKKAHFLGNPIDYIIFEEDEIVFLEVKSGNSKLSPSQTQIKKLIEDKKIKFEQLQIN